MATCRNTANRGPSRFHVVLRLGYHMGYDLSCTVVISDRGRPRFNRGRPRLALRPRCVGHILKCVLGLHHIPVHPHTSHTHTHTHSHTHTRTRDTPGVSSSAEPGNPRIWNPTTVVIFGMIGSLSERNPITVCCTALQTDLSGLSRIVFCNCRDSDVGIICRISHQIRDYSGTGFGKDGWHLARSGHNLDSIGNKRQWKLSPDHARSKGHRPDTVQTTQDIVTVLIRYSRICHDIVTIVIRLHTIGWVSRMLRDAPNCREWLADISGPFAISRTLLRTYTTAFRQW